MSKPEVALTPEQAYIAIQELLASAKAGDMVFPETVSEWIDYLGSKGKLPGRPETTKTIWAESIVSQRDYLPYVRLSTDEDGILAQLTTGQARDFAGTVHSAAAHAEADCAIYRFCKAMEFSDQLAGVMMSEFRNLRGELEKKSDAN